MSKNAIDANRIGPQIDLEAIELPSDVGEAMQRLYGTATPPLTAADWAAVTERAMQEAMDRKPTVDDLCTTDDGAHAFEPATDDPATDDLATERQEYVCVLDPIGYPYLTDTPGTITSRTPIREETVTITIDESGIESSHEDAVVSIGLSDHADTVDELTPEVIYRQVCGYIHTFANEAEYEEWAATVDATTTPVPLETGIGLAGAIAAELFE